MRRLLAALALVLLAAPVRAQVAFAANGNTTVTAGTGTCTPSTTTLGSVGANDIILLVVTGEHDRNAHALTTANNFVQISSPTVFGGDGDVTEENPEIGFSVWWVRGSSWSAAPVVTDTGDHTSCALHRFTGAVTSGDPWDVQADGNDSNANDTSANIPGATTTVADTLVVLIQGTSNNATSTANCGAVTNADLASITEQFDSSNTSNLGGGHCVVTGTKASIGTYATSTLTMGATTYKGAMSLALKPAPPPDNPVFRSLTNVAYANGATCVVTKPSGTVDNDVMVAHIYWESTNTPTGVPSGWALKASVLQDTVGSVFRHYVYWKRAASEGADYTWTWAGAEDRDCTIASYSGVIDSGDPFADDDWAATSSPTTAAPNVAVTTTEDNSLLIYTTCMWLIATTASAYTSPITDERLDSGSVMCALADGAQVSLGASGNKSSTWSGSDDGTAWLGALRPIAEGAPTCTVSIALMGVGCR